MHRAPMHLPRAHTTTRGYRRGSMSKTHPGEKDFTTKGTSRVFDEDHHFIHRDRLPFHHRHLHPQRHHDHRHHTDREHHLHARHAHHADRRDHFHVGKAGSMSKTHPGDMNFTTKAGDRDYHEDHHDQRRSHDPFSRRLKPSEHARAHAKRTRGMSHTPHHEGHAKKKTTKPKSKSSKGMKSKTHSGKDYETRKSDKDFHRDHHDERTRAGSKKKSSPFKKR